MLRFLTAGESHGPALSMILEGMPAGVPISSSYIAEELSRRRLGYGRGPRMKIEQDQLELISGVRFGKSLGSPISVVIRNSEWAKWQRVMSAEGQPAGNILTEPRPGHADLAGMMKYDARDARDILERASARETAARTAAGALAKMLLSELGVSIVSHVVSIGTAETSLSERPGPHDLEKVDSSEVRCLDPDAAAEMVREIEAAGNDGDSLGGVFEVVVYGAPAGLGSYVHWDRRLDARLAFSLMSIPAIKGVEVGEAFSIAKKRGSESHDEIFFEDGGFRRHSARAGGTEGGMSIGGQIILRAAMKPLSTLKRPLNTVDVETKQAAAAFKERTDVCSVPAAAVVGEAVVALVIANAMMEKFGGDTLGDMKQALATYLSRLSRI